MIANNATVGQKACELAVIEFPISNILIKINGTIVNVGEGLDCYFSPDGSIIRSGGNGQKGDYLYWNSSKYDLDTNDEIDFEYLVGYDYETLNSGTTVSLKPIYESIVVKYVGDSGTTMTVLIDNETILVGNVNNQFVWDIGGPNEHIFTNINEYIDVTINTKDYTIWFDGFGSLIFSVKKGKITTTKYLISLVNNDPINGNISDIKSINENIIFTTDNKINLYNTTTQTYSILQLPQSYNNHYSINNITTIDNKILLSMSYKEEEYVDKNSIFYTDNLGQTWNTGVSYDSSITSYNICNLVNGLDGNVYSLIIKDNVNNSNYNYSVLKSINSGETWTEINSAFTYLPSPYIFILDDDNIWMYGIRSFYTGGTYFSRFMIFKLNDGGQTNSQIYESTSLNLEDLRMIDSNNGFILNRDTNQIMKTTDGGVNWNPVSMNITIDDYYYLYKMDIVSNKIFVGLYTEFNKSYILISDDYGLTWEEKLITNLESHVVNILVISDMNIVVELKLEGFYNMPTLFRTTDGGNTWNQILNENNQYLFSEFSTCSFINDNVGWVAANNDKILIKTTDGGQTWYLYDINEISSDTSFNNVTFTSNNIGYLFGTTDGSYPIILKTIDGGNTWSAQTCPYQELSFYDVRFINDNIGYALGKYRDYNLNNTIYVFIKTTDGGLNWVDCQIPSNIQWNSIAFKDSLNGILVGKDSNNSTSMMYITNDGANSWTELSGMTLPYYGFYYIYYKDKYYMSVSYNENVSVGYLYQSVDGITWSDSNVVFDDNTGGIGIISFYNNIGFFTYHYQDGSCCIYQSNNNGTTWNKVDNTTITGGYNCISKGYIFGVKNTGVNKILKLT